MNSKTALFTSIESLCNISDDDKKIYTIESFKKINNISVLETLSIVVRRIFIEIEFPFDIATVWYKNDSRQNISLVEQEKKMTLSDVFKLIKDIYDDETALETETLIYRSIV